MTIEDNLVKNVDIFNPLPATAAPDLLSYKVNKTFDDQRPNLYLTIDTASNTYAYLWQLATDLKYSLKTKKAFVKAYYLYYFLIERAGLGDQLYTEDLNTAIGVSEKTRKMINKDLQWSGILTIHKEKYNESRRKMVEANKYGEYYRIEHHTYDFSINPSSYSTRKPNQQKLSYHLPKKIWQKLVAKGFAFRDRAFLYEELEKEEFVCKGSVKPIKLLKKSIYIPPYHKLSLSPLLTSKRVEDAKEQKIDISYAMMWIKEKSNPVKFTSGRLYHAFHRSPRNFRKYLEHNGSCLMEIMDISNAFFVILSKIFHVADRTNNSIIMSEELASWDKLTREGRLYEEVMKFTHNPIRDDVKKSLNAFKNDDWNSMVHYPEYSFFKKYFPTIVRAMGNYPTYTKEDGTETKYIQIDASFIETYLMSSVCDVLIEFGITPFTLHDGIYASKYDKEILEEHGIKVNEIFWDTFDSMTDDDVIALIKKSRACHHRE